MIFSETVIASGFVPARSRDPEVGLSTAFPIPVLYIVTIAHGLRGVIFV